MESQANPPLPAQVLIKWVRFFFFDTAIFSTFWMVTVYEDRFHLREVLVGFEIPENFYIQIYGLCCEFAVLISIFI